MKQSGVAHHFGLGTVLLASLAVLAGCDDGGLDTVRTGTLTATPPRFVFSKVALGGNEDRTVELQNNGSGDVKIARIRANWLGDQEFNLYWKRAGDEGEPFVGVTAAGGDKFSYPITIKPDESFFLVLNYAPKDEVQPEQSGQIVLETNLSGDDQSFEIPIVISETEPEINVAPPSVDFGRVPAQEDSDETVTVTNIGSSDLTIDQILLNGSQDFVPLINGKDPRRQPEILQDPDGDGNVGVAPNAHFDIVIRYAPLAEGPDAAELSIFSNDQARPEVKVAIAANGATPCLDVTPPAVEFRTSLVNRTDSRPLTVESCGGEQLEITRISISEDSDPAFVLDADSVPALPAILPAATPDAGAPSRTILIEFTPREQRIYNGKLIIESTDPVNPRREVSLLGRGVLNACPQARATQEELFQLPLDSVVLDGTPSIDQDGPENRPVQYEWVVTSRPEGSTSAIYESFNQPADPSAGGIPDDPLTPVAVFWVDLAGNYTIELRVTDNLGLNSTACENPALVHIVAKPEEAIHIQLVWRTPSDPDETDRQGTDLDLHLLHPTAENWFAAPYDAYYANPVPDWGQLENPGDDPSLDIDDINGAGPENINLNNPENTDLLGAPYLIGVHYYRSDDLLTGFDYGESIAKVRVFLSGELAWDFTEEGDPGEKAMQATDHFWDVAQIHWPEARVVKRDIYYDQRP